MDNTKFAIALVVVVAGMYLWYQRGLITRDHQLCMGATQTLMEQQPGQFVLKNVEQFKAFVDNYSGWYGYCRANRLQRRDPEVYEFLVEASERQGTE